MKKKINEHTIELKQGDITQSETDAIVNAANGSLLGGGGVDGAIHRAAGNELVEECKKVRNEELDGEKLATGEAVITDGYQLPARHVIHTVGPVWGGDEEEKKELLANCYRNALSLASENELNSVSLPSISTGVYSFPIEQAASIAMEAITEFLQEQEKPSYVAMVLFSEKDYETYAAALEKAI